MRKEGFILSNKLQTFRPRFNQKMLGKNFSTPMATAKRPLVFQNTYPHDLANWNNKLLV